MQQLDREVAQDTSPKACCVCNPFGCKLKLMQHILLLPHCSPHLRHCIPGQPMLWLASAVNKVRDFDINAMLETVSAQTRHAPLITDTSHYGQDVPYFSPSSRLTCCSDIANFLDTGQPAAQPYLPHRVCLQHIAGACTHHTQMCHVDVPFDWSHACCILEPRASTSSCSS